MSSDQPTATATPRTDTQPLVKIYDRAGMPYDSELVSPDFARTLERELSSAQAALAEAKAEVARMKESYLAGQSLAAAQLATLRENANHNYEAGKKQEEAFLRQFNITKTAEAELTALRARVAELEQDKARLDLMETNAAEVRVEWDDGEAPIPPEFSILVRGTGVIGRGPTLRAAIDAAKGRP